MTYSATCPSCNRHIALTYDEADSTPLYCPFCGEPGDENIGEYDREDDSLGEWNDDDDL